MRNSPEMYRVFARLLACRVSARAVQKAISTKVTLLLGRIFKMKKWLSLIGVGFLGMSALQGCASTVSSEKAESLAKTEDAVNACYTNNGLNPTKAALAVAMADELG